MTNSIIFSAGGKYLRYLALNRRDEPVGARIARPLSAFMSAAFADVNKRGFYVLY